MHLALRNLKRAASKPNKNKTGAQLRTHNTANVDLLFLLLSFLLLLLSYIYLFIYYDYYFLSIYLCLSLLLLLLLVLLLLYFREIRGFTIWDISTFGQKLKKSGLSASMTEATHLPSWPGHTPEDLDIFGRSPTLLSLFSAKGRNVPRLIIFDHFSNPKPKHPTGGTC